MEETKNHKDTTLSRLPVVICLAVVCTFLWGSATPAIKIGYEQFHIEGTDSWSIIVFAGLRFLLAGLMVIGFYCIQKKRLILPPAGAGSCILKLCLCQTVLQYYFFYMGLVYVTGVHGAIITGTNVFLSILIACLLFGYEQLTGRKLLGCLFGLAGIVLVNLSGQTSEGLFDVSFRGEGFVFIAQIFYALSGALVKRYSKQYDVVVLSGYQFTMGGIILILIGLGCGGRVDLMAGAEAVVLLLYLGLISAVAYTLWSILLKYNPVSRVTVFGFMIPVFGVLLSAVFLGESSQALSWNVLAALIVGSLGIFVVNTSEKPEKKDGTEGK